MASNTTTAHRNTDVLPTSFYGYVPTLWICCTFVVLFGITTLLHVIQSLALKPRFYWIIPTTATCGIGEILGWSGRLWNSKNPINGTAYMIQLCTTIIAPTFLTAALYTILGLVITILGPQYSRLTAKKYVAIFVTADVLALVVQAFGGALAATGSNNDRKKANLGANIMVGGIFFQLAGITLYTILATEFLLRFHYRKPFSNAMPNSIGKDSPMSSTYEGIEKTLPSSSSTVGMFSRPDAMPRRIGLLVLGLVLATVFVYIRTVYRAIELLGGWQGHIIRTEVFFDVLDATPIVLAMFILNFFAPGFLLDETMVPRK